MKPTHLTGIPINYCNNLPPILNILKIFQCGRNRLHSNLCI